MFSVRKVLSGDDRKIWLFDIENALLADDAIQFCEVIGLTTGKEDVPVAHLVLKKGYTKPLGDIIHSIHDGCKKALSKHAVPRGYKIRDSFNALPSGKRDILSLKNERSGFFLSDVNGLREVAFCDDTDFNEKGK